MKHATRILLLGLITINTINSMEQNAAVTDLENTLQKEGYRAFISKLFNYEPTEEIQTFINRAKCTESCIEKRKVIEAMNFTLLHNAARTCNSDALYILSQHGADLCAQDTLDRTPYDILRKRRKMIVWKRIIEKKQSPRLDKIEKACKKALNMLDHIYDLEAKGQLSYQLLKNGLTDREQDMINWALAYRGQEPRY